MTSTSGSSKHSPIEAVAVVAHGRIDVDEAVARVRAVAERAGVQLVDEPVFEIEAYMVCTHIDLFRHGSHLTPGTRHLTPAVQTKFCRTFAIAAIRRSARRSAAR